MKITNEQDFENIMGLSNFTKKVEQHKTHKLIIYSCNNGIKVFIRKTLQDRPMAVETYVNNQLFEAWQDTGKDEWERTYYKKLDIN